MELRTCVTDEDYEAWRQVRLAVVPDERCLSVPEMRALDSPSRLLLIATVDGAVVGSGLGDLSDTSGAAFVAPRVMPEHRRRGYGSALLEALTEHGRSLGVPRLTASVDDDGALAFAIRHGFAEVDREVQQVREVADEPPAPPPPPGVEVVLLADRPDLWDACYETFGKEVLADFAIHTPLDISADHWRQSWAGDPMFLALADGEVVGCAGLDLDGDHPGRADNALTGVRRDWRGRGVAAHLKLRTLHWAATHGVTEVSTWTQAGNRPMLQLNERLGYVTRSVAITVNRAITPG